MTKLSTAKARQEFSELLNRTAYGKERIVLTRRKKDLAALIPIEDLKTLEDLENQIDLEDARKALEDVKRHGSVPWDKIKKSKKRR